MASEESAPSIITGCKLQHSQSTPVGVDAISLTDATAEAKQRSGKMLSVAVTMLDDIVVQFHVQHKALGQVLFELVCKQLSLLEVDYFGLEYEDSTNTKYWLDLEKPMNRQLGLSLLDCSLHFGVKFYTPDPAQLEEEYTRYLFCLQIKKDLAFGTLQCNDNTAAVMASYIVQADCGDYIADDYPDHTYLASYKFVPHQDEDLERRIMENHKRHVGQSPAEADLNLLETVRRCELYGIRMHPAKDHEGVPLNLAVAHMGVLVFQNYTKINTFSWAKVRKLSFKRKRFLIKLHPEGYASSAVEGGSSCQGYYKDTVEFYFDSRNECKNFWKKCVEHHGFFRCNTVKKLPRHKTRVLSRGSSFRYSGRTQKQIVDYVRENYIKRQPFQRSQSFRHSSSAHSGIGQVQNSKSAQPLLPVGDHSVGTPASHSCGSMVLNDSGSTEAMASPSLERADVHSESMASGELSISPTSSPKRSSDHFRQSPQRHRTEDTIGVDIVQGQEVTLTNGKATEEWTTESIRKGGEPKPTLPPQSSTDSPVSRSSSLPQDGGSSKEHPDADDTVSQDSYQLLESDCLGSPRQRVSIVDVASKSTDGRQCNVIQKSGVDNNNHNHPPIVIETLPSNSDIKHAENEQGKGMMGQKKEEGGDPIKINGEISYVLRKRIGVDNDVVSEKFKESETISVLSDTTKSTESSVVVVVAASCGGNTPKLSRATTNKGLRINVEVEHPKITQSSPTLYARSRLNRDESPLIIRRRRSSSSSASPKSPRTRSLDFVHVHDLPAKNSYSSKDDSLNGNGSFEKQIADHLERKKRDRESSSASSLASSTSATSSQSGECVILEPLRIVEDGDEVDEVTGPFRCVVRSCVVDKPVKSYVEVVHIEDDGSSLDSDEWEKLAPTFPPPPPPPLTATMPSSETPDTIHEARSKFLLGTIGSMSSINGRPNKIHSFEEVGSDLSCDDTGDNETTVTVEESSDTGEPTVIENFSARSFTITELELDDDDEEFEGGGEAKAPGCEAYTTFGGEDDGDDEQEDDDDAYTEEVTASIHDDTANAETESLPREGDFDDDDVEPCPPLMEDSLLLYPVRTLSRISERSTSEQSESKDSTPTQESKPSDDRHPSVGELPSDYSVSDDNPLSDHVGDGGRSSNESECSPSRGRAPGTGTGLGLSPIRGYESVAHVEGIVRSYENRYVLSDNDADGSQVETYYVEIDSQQKAQLEEEGVFYKVDYEPTLGEDTSSADNDTLVDEGSFHEGGEFLSDVSSPEDQWREVAGATGSISATTLESIKEQYEGLGVCIPARSPTSPLRSPDPSNFGCSSSSKRRHRTCVELQVSNGQILENKHASMTSPITEEFPVGTIFNRYAKDCDKE